MRRVARIAATVPVWAVAVAAVGLGGCSRPGSAPTVPAAGRLVCGERPLPNIDIVFTPEHGRRGFATTDAQGWFAVSTFAVGDGAVPGKHTLTLWPHPSEAQVVMDSRAAQPTWNSVPLPFPRKYASAANTDLVVDLGDKGSRNLELALEDNP